MNPHGTLWVLREVAAQTRLSKAQIYKLMRAGRFPRQIRISDNRVAWLASEVEDWIAKLAASRATA